MWSIKKTLLVLILSLMVSNINAKDFPKWKPSPCPSWYMKLSDATKHRLLSVGMSDSSFGYVPNYAITEEERVMISKYGYIWTCTYNDDNYDDFLIRMQDDYGRIFQLRVCRRWL